MKKVMQPRPTIKDWHLVCPFCQCDHVHIEKVEVDRMGEITIVDGNNPVDFVTADKHFSPLATAGSSVTTYFFCENGHRWMEVRQFHKGYVFAIVGGPPRWEAEHPNKLPED